jgi:hypothetical protein
MLRSERYLEASSGVNVLLILSGIIVIAPFIVIYCIIMLIFLTSCVILRMKGGDIMKDFNDFLNFVNENTKQKMYDTILKSMKSIESDDTQPSLDVITKAQISFTIDIVFEMLEAYHIWLSQEL